MTTAHDEPRGDAAAETGHPPSPAWKPIALLRWLAGVAPLDPSPKAEGEWRLLADRCAAIRVLPQMFLRQDAEPGSIPPADAREHARRRLDSVVRTSRVLQGGCRTLRILGSAGIPAVGFKGIAAVGWLHGGRPTRGIGDADIAVSPSRSAEAIEVLLAAGFHPTLAGIPHDEVVRFSRGSPGSAGNESLSLTTDEGVEVDLHWKLGAFDVDAMLADARRIRVLSDEVPLVRPGTGLLLTVHHSLRNDFVPDECIRDLLDAVGWLRILATDSVESAWTDQEARRIGLDAAIEAFALVLSRNGVNPMRPSCLAGTASTLLADLFLEQCDAGPLNTDLVYLCSLGPGWRLFRALIGGGAGYLRAMRAMEAANGESQQGIGERFRRLASDAWRVPPDRWRCLRELARCKNRVC